MALAATAIVLLLLSDLTDSFAQGLAADLADLVVFCHCLCLLGLREVRIIMLTLEHVLVSLPPHRCCPVQLGHDDGP